jgi:hypothetical protein
LKKRSNLGAISGSGNEKDKKGEEQEVNVEELLNDLRREVIKVYRTSIPE